MDSPTLTTKSRPQSLEAVAYFEGAHGVDIKPGLDRIEATFDQKAAELSRDAVCREKKHEETLGRVDAQMPEAQAKADEINARVRGETPQVVMPAVAILGVLFIATMEVVMAAPALDVLTITSPTNQVLAAIGFMFLSCFSFHFAWESFASDRFAGLRKFAIRALAVLVAVFLVIWGVLRGHQVAFASDLNGSPLARFLSGHPILASGFYIFVTLVPPLVVATATHFGFHYLRNWWEWKTANARLRNLKDAKVNSEKQLETEREQHRQTLKQLNDQCAEWKRTYEIHHGRGSQHGSIREPMAIVYMKTAVVTLAVGAVLFFAPVVIEGAGTTIAAITAFLYFRHKREHPNPEQYYKVHNVQFVPPMRDVSITQERPLLEATNEPKRARKGLPS